MDAKKVDVFIMDKKNYFPENKTMYVKEKLMEISEERSYMLDTVPLKNPMTILIVSILLGVFGVDRFMCGDIGIGVLKLLSFGGCGIWWIIDIFIVPKKVKEDNFNKFMTMI